VDSSVRRNAGPSPAGAVVSGKPDAGNITPGKEIRVEDGKSIDIREGGIC